ncbi:Vacuolar protein sorting-associated protein 36-like protein [Drosera capensis]
MEEESEGSMEFIAPEMRSAPVIAQVKTMMKLMPLSLCEPFTHEWESVSDLCVFEEFDEEGTHSPCAMLFPDQASSQISASSSSRSQAAWYTSISPSSLSYSLPQQAQQVVSYNLKSILFASPRGKAKEMVVVAGENEAEILSSSNNESSVTNNDQMGSKVEIRDWLLSVGVVSPVRL